jgi:Ca2+/Na+ antiporter
MNEQTANLIKELAIKLGTTTEYLWTVLMQQAFVSSIIDCIFYIMYFVFMYYMFKGYKYMLGKNEGSPYTRFENMEEGQGILVLFLIVISIAFTTAFILTVSSTITGFINPEYWALEKILKNIK